MEKKISPVQVDGLEAQVPKWKIKLWQFGKDLKKGFIPYATVPGYMRWSFGIIWLILIVNWFNNISIVLPDIDTIPGALIKQWSEYSLGTRVYNTGLNIVIAYTVACSISYLLAFISVINFFVVPVKAFQTFRFFSLAGVILILVKVLEGSQALVIGIMVFFMSTFLTDSMGDVVKKGVPRSLKNLALTLGFSPWRAWYEVTIRSTRLERHLVTKSVFAIAWATLPNAEGKNRTAETLGNLVISSNKFNALEDVFAIVFLVFGIGICLDLCYNYYIKKTCGYKLKGIEGR